MTALEQLIDAYHASFADSDSQDPDPILIAAAIKERAELVAALRLYESSSGADCPACRRPGYLLERHEADCWIGKLKPFA